MQDAAATEAATQPAGVRPDRLTALAACADVGEVGDEQHPPRVLIRQGRHQRHMLQRPTSHAAQLHFSHKSVLLDQHRPANGSNPTTRRAAAHRLSACRRAAACCRGGREGACLHAEVAEGGELGECVDFGPRGKPRTGEVQGLQRSVRSRGALAAHALPRGGRRARGRACAFERIPVEMQPRERGQALQRRQRRPRRHRVVARMERFERREPRRGRRGHLRDPVAAHGQLPHLAGACRGGGGISFVPSASGAGAGAGACVGAGSDTRPVISRSWHKASHENVGRWFSTSVSSCEPSLALSAAARDSEASAASARSGFPETLSNRNFGTQLMSHATSENEEIQLTEMSSSVSEGQRRGSNGVRALTPFAASCTAIARVIGAPSSIFPSEYLFLRASSSVQRGRSSLLATRERASECAVDLLKYPDFSNPHSPNVTAPMSSDASSVVNSLCSTTAMPTRGSFSFGSCTMRQISAWGPPRDLP